MSIDWSDAHIAMLALKSGITPPGYSINEAGQLVVPDEIKTTGLRGHSLITAWFDEIVTSSGQVVKSRSAA